MKWLVNELAAVVGELASLDEHLAVLAQRRHELVKLRESLELVGHVLGTTTLARDVPPVRPHRGRRGQLTSFLRVAVREAAPSPLKTASLAKMAETQLHLSFETEQARNAFRDNNVSRAMRKLVAAGLVERVNNVDDARAHGGEWRWKQPAATNELLLLKGAR